MRLLINCPSGESRLLQVADEALVSELKLELKELEGIPVLQQVLVHAGKPLKDHLSLGDHQLNDFTLSDEVVLYLSKKRAHPKTIFLMSWSNPALKISECVESDASVGSVMELLVSRGIASPFNQGATTLCKRQDGSTIPFNVNPDEPLSALEVKLKQLENIEVQGLTFVQAQDGCMHISVWPSSAAPESLPVYVRSNGPQPPLRKKTVTAGTTTLADLSKELCV